MDKRRVGLPEKRNKHRGVTIMSEESTAAGTKSSTERTILYMGLAAFVVSLVFVLYTNKNSKEVQVRMEEVQQAHQALVAEHRKLQEERDVLVSRVESLETEEAVLGAKLETSSAWFGRLQEDNKELSSLMYTVRLSLVEQAVLLNKSSAVAADRNLARAVGEIEKYQAILDQYFLRRESATAQEEPDDSDQQDALAVPTDVVGDPAEEVLPEGNEVSVGTQESAVAEPSAVPVAEPLADSVAPAPVALEEATAEEPASPVAEAVGAGTSGQALVLPDAVQETAVQENIESAEAAAAIVNEATPGRSEQEKPEAAGAAMEQGVPPVKPAVAPSEHIAAPDSVMAVPEQQAAAPATGDLVKEIAEIAGVKEDALPSVKVTLEPLPPETAGEEALPEEIKQPQAR